ncbi:MAG: hypothetical protein S4CHLAM6_01910 [Chlamydiae bacterium]|nr:hypothetical protein [Chlamydiota bacterium]
MTGAFAAVTDLFDFNPPTSGFSSCSEYAIAQQEYMSNKCSNIAFLLGSIVGGGVFYKNPRHAPNLYIRAAHSFVGGAILPIITKIFFDTTKSFHIGVQERMCDHQYMLRFMGGLENHIY